MNLIDKYVAEVGKHLPHKGRADIEAEIRSTLEDMLEERDQASAEDEAAVIALLKEYGEPRKIAESYIGPRYLIGPRLYPTFIMVTKIVATVLLFILLAALGLNLSRSSLTGPELLSTLGDSFAGLLSGLIAAFGNIVLVFAILERTLPADEFENKAEDWDPAELTKDPDPDHVKIGEQIIGIIFTAVFLIVLNLYPDIIGFGIFQNEEWIFISPILSDAFFSYLPWVNIIGVLQITFGIVLLRQGSWQLWTRITHILLKLGSVALAIAMLKGPSLVALDAEKFARTPLADDAWVFVSVAQWIPTIVLTIVIVVSSMEIGQAIYRLMKKKQASPYPIME